MEKQSRSILAILSTDIPGYTQKTEEDESYAFTLIAKHRDIISKHIGESNGFTFKEMGDGTFNKFDSAIDASRCAIKIQSEAIERNLPLRVGLHLGDVVQEGDDILGVGVNIADRIQSHAKPGTIYISDDINRQIKNQSDLNTTPLGEYELKGIKGKMTLYELIFNPDGTVTEKIEVTHKIQVHDEEGNKVEKETPKNEFLKSLVMFLFDNKTNNSDLDWLQYGIPQACHYTLRQEKLIIMDEPHSYNEYYAGYSVRTKGANDLNLPVSLKKKITNQQNKDYWVSGNISNHTDGYCITTQLHDGKLGKLLCQREFVGDNIFTIIDNIALQIRYDLGIPSSHIESTDSLSISDNYTNNMEAFELYMKGKFEIKENKEVRAVKETLESAVDNMALILKHDKEFSIIYKDLAFIHLFLGNDDKMKECLEKAMELLHKFPESLQYEVKSNYFTFVEKNPEKIIKLHELWTKLQPHNIEAHKELASSYMSKRDADKALEQLLIIFEMTPSDFYVLSDIVDIYIMKNNFEDAKKILKDFGEKYPDNYKPYAKLGELYESMGGFEKAKEQYEIVSLIEPNINEITLAKIETKFGKFDLAVNKLIDLYKNPKSRKNQKYSTLRALLNIYYKIGKVNKIIEASEEAYKLDPTWPFTAMEDAVALAKIYIKMKNEKAANEALDKVKQIFPAEDKSFLGSFLNVFKADFHLERNDFKKVEQTILEIERMIQELGFQNLIGEKERVLSEFYEKKGDWRNALKHYYLSVDTPPGWGWEPAVRDLTGIGRCHRELKEYNQSVESLLEFLKLDPYDPRIHYELALSYNEMKNRTKALEHIQVAVDVWKYADASFTIAQDAKNKLKEWNI